MWRSWRVWATVYTHHKTAIEYSYFGKTLRKWRRHHTCVSPLDQVPVDNLIDQYPRLPIDEVRRSSAGTTWWVPHQVYRMLQGCWSVFLLVLRPHFYTRFYGASNRFFDKPLSNNEHVFYNVSSDLVVLTNIIDLGLPLTDTGCTPSVSRGPLQQCKNCIVFQNPGLFVSMDAW